MTDKATTAISTEAYLKKSRLRVMRAIGGASPSCRPSVIDSHRFFVARATSHCGEPPQLL
jgi:hypothetical protein